MLQFKQQILAAILLLYHLLIWAINDPLSQFSLSLVLYGLFLVWQPLWNRATTIKVIPTILACSIFLFLTYRFANEALVAIGLILAGLIGSRLLTRRRFRGFDLLALVIITLEMTVGLVPNTFSQIELPTLFSDYMQTVILVPVLLYFLAPNSGQRKPEPSQIDLMHGLLSAILLFVVLLGSIVINLLYGVDYVDGLLLTVFIVATMTFGISWFWNPNVGYSGIGVLWNRYTMSIGGPFEIWINTLTTLIEERYLTPREFLEAACEHLVENEWLMAIQWKFENHSLLVGKESGLQIEHQLGDKVLVILTFKASPSEALTQHTLLLTRMAYQFYLAKLNQEKVRAQEHFATIHHTGARLTHDIKNILQSIKTSIGIVNMADATESSQALLQGNLNQISARLESTLRKLQTPKLDTQVNLVSCNKWAYRITGAYASNPKIRVRSEITNNLTLPVDLFDSVLENLTNNALRKKSATKVTVRLLSTGNMIVLSVCDNGDIIPKEIEESLFVQPVSSGSGMGIGLYQSAIMANAFNYRLELSQNEPGRICFNLYQHIGGG